MSLYRPRVCPECGGDVVWCGCGKSSGLPYIVIGVALYTGLLLYIAGVF